MRRLLNTLTLPALCLALTAVLPACSGGGSSGGGTAGSSNVDVLLTDTPADDLLSFRATVDEVRLEIAGGGETNNLLAGSVSMDLLALQGSFAWMASQDLPAATYTGVRFVFAPGAYDARKNDGTSVAVNALSNAVTLDFTPALVVTTTGYKKVVADIDLASSLSGNVNAPPLVFDPQGSAIDGSSTSSHQLDEFEGTVVSSNASASTLLLNASVDDDGAVALGQVLVHVSSSTVLIADNDSAFASRAAFFAALVPGTTHLEVHGALVGGAVNATRIEVEDNQAGGGGHNLVKITGLVLGIQTSSFDMSIGHVVQGAAIVAAANGGTIPATLHVTFDGSTLFIGENEGVANAGELAIGSHVMVKFSTFTNPPYIASRVHVYNAAHEVENEGQITSIAGLPSTLTVHLDANSPAVLGGQVTSSSTNVMVTLSGAPITLNTSGHPSIASSALQNGLELEVEGTVGGTPASPTISASEVQIHAGELSDALVTSINSGAGSFTTSGGEIEEPFGTGVSPGPQSVLLAPNCVFTGATHTRNGFWLLFSSLESTQTLEVRVKGISTGGVNVIRAYEVRAQVHHN